MALEIIDRVNHADRLMNYQTLSEYLRISPAQVRILVMKRDIPFIKIGNNKRSPVRFRRSDIDMWLLSQSIPANKAVNH